MWIALVSISVTTIHQLMEHSHKQPHRVLPQGFQVYHGREKEVACRRIDFAVEERRIIPLQTASCNSKSRETSWCSTAKNNPSEYTLRERREGQHGGRYKRNIWSQIAYLRFRTPCSFVEQTWSDLYMPCLAATLQFPRCSEFGLDPLVPCSILPASASENKTTMSDQEVCEGNN